MGDSVLHHKSTAEVWCESPESNFAHLSSTGPHHTGSASLSLSLQLLSSKLCKKLSPGSRRLFAGGVYSSSPESETLSSETSPGGGMTEEIYFFEEEDICFSGIFS